MSSLEYLAAAAPDDRLRRATELFVKQASITEVTKKIAQSIDESLSKQQKEFFLRQQLAAIQRELAVLHTPTRRGRSNSSPSSPSSPTSPTKLGAGGLGGLGEEEDGNNEEELMEIKRRFEQWEAGSEERKMAEREWRRLRRIPPQSAEHGVIQNYVREFTSDS